MDEMGSAPGAVEIIEGAQDAPDGKRVSVGEILDAVGYRGYGPIYILVGLILISPIGILPGVSSASGLIIILLAIQKLLGRRSPWLPHKVLKLSMQTAKYERALERAKGLACRIDHVARERLSLLSHESMQRVTAFVVILLGIALVPFEVVPLGQDVPAIALLLIGVGKTSQDGLFVAVGLAVAPASVIALLTVF